jgi:hypothetical protein
MLITAVAMGASPPAVGADPTDERLVNFKGIDQKLSRIAQAGVACAEIVDRNLHPLFPLSVNSRTRDVGSLRTDVADGCRHQYPFRVFQRAQHQLYRKIAAVLAAPDQLDPSTDLLRQSVFRRAQATSRSAKPSGMMFVTFCPRSSSRW